MRELRFPSPQGFSLVEVVMAMGIVSFSVLATVALLSVGNDTNRKARDEAFAAQLATNEFERLRSYGAARLKDVIVVNEDDGDGEYPRYFDSNIAEVPTASAAVYELRVAFVKPAPAAAADILANAEVRYPANATAANQAVFHYTTLMNIPKS